MSLLGDGDLEGLFVLECDPDAPAALAGLLSLVVPGLGQVWIGQWMRGLRLFLGSASVLFGCGLCNLLVAYDAWSLATRLQQEDLATDDSSKTMWAFGVVWALLGFVVRGIGDTLAETGGPGLMLATPWIVYDALVYGRGGRA
ncbi:MAG: hypothetical protein R3F61_37085 [Myxococcota bacterium]